MSNILWHNLQVEEVFGHLKSGQNGLSGEEVKKRQAKFGLNKLPEAKKPGILILVLGQLKSPLVYVLLAAAAISFILQDFMDVIIILIAVALNTVLGFYQENKANNALFFLKQYIKYNVKVLRDNKIALLNTVDLVPGDVILLNAGDKVPADSRIIKADNLEVIEAILTGESIPSEKNTKIMGKGGIIAERKNMLFSGTEVARGSATAVVCETGLETEIGKISQMINDTKEEATPLQVQLKKFSNFLTMAVIAVSFLIIIFSLIQGRKFFGIGSEASEGILNTAAALAVSAIPEGLLVAVTAILAIGMRAILKKNSLVRRLYAAETLGSVSVICTDKTGTLTEGKMQVSHIISLGKEISLEDELRYQAKGSLFDHDLMLKIAILCSDAVILNPDDELHNYKISGGPTESALILAAIQSGIPYSEILNDQPRLSEIPFDSDAKYMATINKLDDKKNVIYLKGAPEKILQFATQIRVNGKKEKLTPAKVRALTIKYEHLTRQGLRVLAFAYKQLPKGKAADINDELNDLIFAGLVALKDPIRPEAKNTFQMTTQAGIKTILVTGDHKYTAKAVFEEIGMKIAEKNILTGLELDDLSDQQLIDRIDDILIYARVEPRHKLRIVKAWQAQGEVVAMTGDGVNDAPALKAADVGIALGSGTDVAKETSDLVLLDNNFKTIVAAIEQGRVIYDNIKKVLLYLLTDSFSEIVLVAGALFLNLPLPVLASQIIWVNLVDDGIPNLALTMEPGEKGVMNQKPRKKDESIFDRNMRIILFSVGVFYNAVLIGLFVYFVKFTEAEISYIRTLIFTILGVDSLFYVFSVRRLRRSIFSGSIFSNKYLLVAVAISLLMQLSAIYLPFMQKIFQTVSLGINDWLIILSLCFGQILFIEIIKFFFLKDNNIKENKYAPA